MRDDKPRKGCRGPERYSGFETGLRTSKGKQEARLQRRSCSRSPSSATASSDVLWGRVRPATGPTEVTIEHKVGKGRWQRLTALQTAGVYGFKTAHRPSTATARCGRARTASRSPARRSGLTEG